MHEIVVIGPREGQYLIGYYVEARNTFYVIQEFTNKSLANLTAWRMNQSRQKGFA